MHLSSSGTRNSVLPGSTGHLNTLPAGEQRKSWENLLTFSSPKTIWFRPWILSEEPWRGRDGTAWRFPFSTKRVRSVQCLWNSASIFGPDGHTIVSTIAQGQDITDRKRIESESRLRARGYAEMNVVLEEEIRHRKISDTSLKNTLSLLHASLESTADGILVVDRQGKITSFNKNFMDMWNIPPEILESGNYRRAIDHILPQLKNPEGYLTSLREPGQFIRDARALT